MSHCTSQIVRAPRAPVARQRRLSLSASALLLTLVLVPAPLAAQKGAPFFTKDFPAEEFAARRAKVFDAIGQDAVALVQGAPNPPGYVRFRQSNEFYYLTGIEVPHSYLLLDGSTRRAILYLPPRDLRRESSEGRVLGTEDAELVRQLSGVDEVASTSQLIGQLARRAQGPQVVYTPFSPAEGLAVSRDLGMRTNQDIAVDPLDGRVSREVHFMNRLTTSFPLFQLRNLSPILDELRLIKSPREMALIRRATELSGLALLEAMRSTRPGIHEYELDGVARYVFHANGAQGDAYYSLIATGVNATFPHYHKGLGRLEAGEFLLMDYAPDYGYYMSDVTRQWPVDGKFNSWQRELYTFYKDCYEAILYSIKPNVTAQSVMEEAVGKMDAILARSRFSKPIHEQAAREFVESQRRGAQNPRRGLGHGVGMATHDVGNSGGMLLPGMVFTIEPALRVPEEKIYIRLEDVIAIRENGVEIWSDFVPRDVASIEKIMREEGLLQKVPTPKVRQSAAN
jgi:Xaa-Pro aminopeptidase